MQAHAGIGKFRRGQAWPDKARQGKAWPGMARPARQSKATLVHARPGRAR